MPYPNQVYATMLNGLLLSITPALPSGTAGTRSSFGTPEHIPERCFIVGRVTAADGFLTSGERSAFNGFIDDGNQYHENFGFPITRMKSFWEILDFYKTATTDIGRIRIITHGMFDWMEFPMFPGGSFVIGITNGHLDAYKDNDEEGLRWTFTNSRTDSPMIHDITQDIVDGVRIVDSTWLNPLRISAAGSTISGDTKLFLDVVTDHYHLKFGSVVTQPSPTSHALLNPDQKSKLSAAFDYVENEIRKRLEGSTVGTAPDTHVVSKTELDTLKAHILATTPGKLELIGSKTTLPSDIMQPATTIGSLAHARAAVPKVENDLRQAIAGTTSNLMFSNRTGEILASLDVFHKSTLSLSATVIISSWPDIAGVPHLEDYFFICNDLYMMKNGEFEINGTDIDPTQRLAIRTGLMDISNIIKARISGISSTRLNTLRTTIENLSWQESKSTDIISIIPERKFSELHAAVGGLNTGFRANLLKLRSLMKNTSVVDIRGCKIGSAPTYLTKMRNFLGIGTNKPTISAPEWWQSFPPGFQYHGGTSAFNVFPRIDNMVSSGFPGSNISPADVVDAMDLWKGLLEFDAHFSFISALFTDSNTARFNFATLEWRTWQVGGAGAGIPILLMQAQRIDDITTLNIENILERFRIIFELPSSSGLNAAQRTTMGALRPLVQSFKTLKAAIDAVPTPSVAQITQFYSDLDTLVTNIDTIAGTSTPGVLLPPGAQDKAKLDIYVNNVEGYIFTNLDTLLGTFFTNVRGQLGHANSEIRYFCNIGLVLPVQSSSHPTLTNPVVMISFEGFADRASMYMEALRGWMKVQWTGSPAEAAALNTFIDAIQTPALANVSEFARRCVVSDGDPSGGPLGLDSHYCPTTDFGSRIITRP